MPGKEKLLGVISVIRNAAQGGQIIVFLIKLLRNRERNLTVDWSDIEFRHHGDYKH